MKGISSGKKDDKKIAEMLKRLSESKKQLNETLKSTKDAMDKLQATQKSANETINDVEETHEAAERVGVQPSLISTSSANLGTLTNTVSESKKNLVTTQKNIASMDRKSASVIREITTMESKLKTGKLSPEEAQKTESKVQKLVEYYDGLANQAIAEREAMKRAAANAKKSMDIVERRIQVEESKSPVDPENTYWVNSVDDFNREKISKFPGEIKCVIINSKDVKEIPENTFAAIQTLSIVKLENFVESIEKSAFNACKKLSTVEGLDNLKKIGKMAFVDCNELNNLSLPNVTTIGEGAFALCSSLANFSAPKITTIENSTFLGCRSLTDFSFKNITAIGEGAFANSGLKSFEGPDVESVGEEAFAYCRSMINASLPMCATNGMGDYVFSGCSKLKTVYLRWVEVKKIAFGNVLSGCESLEKITLYRPYATKEMSKKIMEQTSKVPIVVSTKVGTNSNHKTFLYSDKDISDIDKLSDKEKNLLNKPRLEVIAVGVKIPTRP